MSPDLLFAEIVIADCDLVFARATRLVLQAAGYTVRVANSEQALAKLIENRRPALLLLGDDLNEHDPYQNLRQVKREYQGPFLPIIFMLTEQQPDQLRSALDAGADDVIYKPIGNAELLVHVRAMLRLGATTCALAELNATLEQKVEQRTRQIEQIYDQMVHSEKLASLGRLSASIAHEINNPLSAILTYLSLIQMQAERSSPIHQHLDIIERQVNAIARLTQELRDFSKPPRKEHLPTQVNEVIGDVLRLITKDLEKHKIQLSVELDHNLPLIDASAEQLAEVILNLIINARDAMHEGGSLCVHTRILPEACIWIEIGDTGTGMPAEVISRIFEPFFTTKGERGTGLGLSISYRIIQEHNGKIAVNSKVGRGTTFMIALPGPEKVAQGIDCQNCSLTQRCLPQEG